MTPAERIVSNVFIESLRVRGEVDHSAFRELLSAVQEYGVSISNQEMIKKEVVADLYVVSQVLRDYGVQCKLAKDNHRAEMLLSLWSELDANINECLSKSD